MSSSSSSSALQSSPVALGDVIDGKYRVDGVLGAGGMGVVVRATHLALRQEVAIKMPLAGIADNREVLERLAREGRAAARLRSEHVCRVLDVGTLESGLPYVVMEYLDGIALSQSLRAAGSLPITRAIDYVRQACDAVGEAHDRGIVHRDLKPANMFLVRSKGGLSKLKVLDFGISKVREGTEDAGLTTTSSFLGSPSYVAPEQMSATYAVDARADVWALGVCLYELVTGRVPFKGGSMMELGVLIATEPAIPPSSLRADVPPRLDAIILKCLSKSADDRFADANALGDALAELMADLDSIMTRRAGATGGGARASDADPSSGVTARTIAHAETQPAPQPAGIPIRTLPMTNAPVLPLQEAREASSPTTSAQAVVATRAAAAEPAKRGRGGVFVVAVVLAIAAGGGAAAFQRTRLRSVSAGEQVSASATAFVSQAATASPSGALADPPAPPAIAPAISESTAPPAVAPLAASSSLRARHAPPARSGVKTGLRGPPPVGSLGAPPAAPPTSANDDQLPSVR